MTVKVIHLDSGDFLNLGYGGYTLEKLNEQLKGSVKVDVFQDPNHGTRFVAQWPDEPPAVIPTPTAPAYVHTFIHAHSNWVAVDPVDGNVFEFIDEPQLDEKGEHYMSPFGGMNINVAVMKFAGLKQKRQR
jgi:hypothetical protein